MATKSPLAFAALLAFGAAESAAAQTAGEPARAAEAPARCAGLGPGAFEAAGSQTCVRVSGYVAAVAGFASGQSRWIGVTNPFDDAPASGAGARIGVRLDVETPTDAGPLRLSVGLGRDRTPP